MKSMTGYGRSTVSSGGRTLTIEIKSVNHRFLDIAFKNFKTFAFAEDTVKKLVENHAARGHIEISVNYSDNRDDAVALDINYNLINEYISSAEQIQETFGIENDIKFSSLMRNGDIFKQVFNADDEEVLLSLITECALQALKELNASREREGNLIKADLAEKLRGIRENVAAIEKRSPSVFAEYKEKLTARIKESLGEIAVDEAKLLNEVAFFTDRAGIDEEIERLKIHISHFFGIIESYEPVGRKMDFTLQEMNREINTTGSKSNDMELSRIVINVKTELEKIREQCQNIE
ncbi:MAG: YicC family protein [Clostridiales bacterium]|jgi:uncharacterized protein (TIGR00255 family)|nr:YicC family protein [Clostridiales bacterium]